MSAQIDLNRILKGGVHGYPDLWCIFPVEALPDVLQPRPGSGLLCPHCGRRFASDDGYIRHAVGRHSDKVDGYSK
jgi:hypothetical protein